MVEQKTEMCRISRRDFNYISHDVRHSQPRTADNISEVFSDYLRLPHIDKHAHTETWISIYCVYMHTFVNISSRLEILWLLCPHVSSLSYSDGCKTQRCSSYLQWEIYFYFSMRYSLQLSRAQSSGDNTEYQRMDRYLSGNKSWSLELFVFKTCCTGRVWR